MQIAPIGAAEAALANLATGAAAQQQLVGAAAQPQGGGTAGTVQEKQATAKTKKPEHSETVALAARDSAPVSTPATGMAAPDQRAELGPSQGVTERQLFDYLAEVEKSGAGANPSELLGQAMHSVDGTMQLVQKVMDEAREAIAGKTSARNGFEIASNDATGADAAGGKPALDGKSADELLEQSISVMWAASNLQVVIGSVTAATSSASTLIKQQ
jgi:hypothetical protein